MRSAYPHMFAKFTAHPETDGQDAKEQEHFLPLGYIRHDQDCENNTLIASTGQLKAKLAKLKKELLTPTSGGGGGGGMSLCIPWFLHTIR